MKFTKEQKKDLDQSINYAVKEGYLDENRAIEMTYQEKKDYLDRSDVEAEWQYEQMKEQEAEREKEK